MTDITLNNGGMKLAASIHGPPNGEPVIFVHALSMSHDTWDEIAAQLSDRYQIWTLDFRGHGHSDRAASARYSQTFSPSSVSTRQSCSVRARP